MKITMYQKIREYLHNLIIEMTKKHFITKYIDEEKLKERIAFYMEKEVDNKVKKLVSNQVEKSLQFSENKAYLRSLIYELVNKKIEEIKKLNDFI